ncbi:hypothetical protein DPMN_164568 [Dreissena polymorpha]|uniref:Uncharacterized protein n=1 Tax=Dreissena polymorpha TaxID=45954 RepID=A0A9D4EY22_DREPO|nr:hypothetical protein DPMN_164568 [Dreissena polymorpha]
MRNESKWRKQMKINKKQSFSQAKCGEIGIVQAQNKTSNEEVQVKQQKKGKCYLPKSKRGKGPATKINPATELNAMDIGDSDEDNDV